MQPMLFHDLPLCLPYRPAVREPSREFVALVEAARNDTLDDACAALENAGWRYAADQSCYCDVLLAPDNDRVIKLGNGYGATATLEAALALPDNPHLPKVFGWALPECGDYRFIAEMEFLDPLSDKDDWGDYGDTDTSGDGENCPSFCRWRASVPWKGNTHGGPDLSAMPDGPLKDALQSLYDRSADCCWDVHDGNIMVRPGTGEIVLNDLLA